MKRPTKNQKKFFLWFFYFLFGFGLANLVWTFLPFGMSFLQETSPDLLTKQGFFLIAGLLTGVLIFVFLPLKFLKKTLKPFVSLKLAIVFILTLSSFLIAGTFLESLYGTFYAQEVLYKSWFLRLIFYLLSVTLIAVMVDRWPWSLRHGAFVTAHIGLLTLFTGFWLNQNWGVDGILALKKGEKNSFIQLSQRELVVMASSGVGEYRQLAQWKTRFVAQKPKVQKPFERSVGQDTLKVLEYIHHAFRKSKFVPVSNERYPPALFFRLEGSRVNMQRWLFLKQKEGQETLDLGPARLTFLSSQIKGWPKPKGPQIFLKPQGDEVFLYRVYEKKGDLVKKGLIKVGEILPTGWMDVKLSLLKFYKQAREDVVYEPIAYQGGNPQSALRVSFQGQEYWLGLNALLRIFTDEYVFFITYRNQMMNLGFPVKLLDFQIENYQGTQRAASYTSWVETGEGKERIFMNNPLKYRGYTFYQASFEKDSEGEPFLSVLSVNKDPGRFLKYYGSFLIILGCIFLFYFRRSLI